MKDLTHSSNFTCVTGIARIAKVFGHTQKIIEDFSLFKKKMLSYCLKCRRNTESDSQKVARIKHGRIMLLSIYALHNNKNSKYIKQQEASGLLISLGIKAP